MIKSISVAALAAFFCVACASSAPDNSAEKARERAKAGYGDMASEVVSAPVAQNAPNQGVSAAGAQAAPVRVEAQAVPTYENVQKPIVMVLPAPDSAGQGGKYVLSHNENSRTAMEAVNEYLTSRSYEVRSLEAQTELDEVVAMMNDISGANDVSYVASLMLGADIYIKYSGSYDIRQQMMNVEVTAYEASTARLLGSQSAHLKNNDTRKESINFIIHDAVKKAMPGLENKILSYWAEDLKKGMQYKVVMNISESFEGSSLEDLQDNVVSQLRSRFSSIRVNAMSERTIDVIIYADAATFPDAYAVYSEIRNVVSPFANAKKNNVSKKLITLDLQ